MGYAGNFIKSFLYAYCNKTPNKHTPTQAMRARPRTLNSVLQKVGVALHKGNRLLRRVFLRRQFAMRASMILSLGWLVYVASTAHERYKSFDVTQYGLSAGWLTYQDSGVASGWWRNQSGNVVGQYVYQNTYYDCLHTHGFNTGDNLVNCGSSFAGSSNGETFGRHCVDGLQLDKIKNDHPDVYEACEKTAVQKRDSEKEQLQEVKNEHEWKLAWGVVFDVILSPLLIIFACCFIINPIVRWLIKGLQNDASDTH
jgi:hypothetical protein